MTSTDDRLENEIWEAIRKHSSPTASREGKEGYVSMHGGQGGIILWERDGKPFVIAEIMKIVRRERSTSSTPSLTNPNPKREDERVEAALSAWMEASDLGLPHWSTGCKPATIEHMRKCMAAALAAGSVPSPGDPVRAALEDCRSHQASWRNALVIAEQHAQMSEPDLDDKLYWQHEIRAFDRTFAALSVSTPTGEGEARDPIRLMQIAQAAMAQACLATDEIGSRSHLQAVESVVHSALRAAGGKIDPTVLAHPQQGGERVFKDGYEKGVLNYIGSVSYAANMELSKQRAWDEYSAPTSPSKSSGEEA